MYPGNCCYIKQWDVVGCSSLGTNNMSVKVLTFNICHSAVLAMPSNGLSEVARIIAESGCDVCAIQEADGKACPTCKEHGVRQADKGGIMLELFCLLSSSLEWSQGHVATGACILSRFPIEAETVLQGDGKSHGSVVVRTPCGHRLLVYNVHLDWQHQPQIALRQNHGIKTHEMVAREWITRGPEVMALLADSQHRCRGMDCSLLVGDFNTQSHLDEIRPSEPLWPVTHALQRHGFEDAFRTVYPDPVLHPGCTWYVPLPCYDMSSEAHGRLDYVFVKGDAVRVHVAEVKHRKPWPSDHKALLVALTIE